MAKMRKPHGREEVMASILEAASELFARHGVTGVSVRDIAARAGVNHGLIHRHFGSKEALRRKAQDMASAEVRAEIGESSSFEEAIIKGWLVIIKKDGFWRMLARTLLDGGLEGDIQSEFPYVKNAVELAGQDQKNGLLRDDMDSRVLVAGLLALGMGLELFGGYILPATGLDQNVSGHTKARILSQWQALLKTAETPDA